MSIDLRSEIGKLTPLLALLTSLFDSPLRFILVGDSNDEHMNWNNLFCSGPSAYFDTKLVTLVKDTLAFRRARAPTWHHTDASPTFVGVITAKDDF